VGYRGAVKVGVWRPYLWAAPPTASAGGRTPCPAHTWGRFTPSVSWSPSLLLIRNYQTVSERLSKK